MEPGFRERLGGPGSGQPPAPTLRADLYTRRWRLDEGHKVLKSGCKAQDHQHQSGERLKGAIAIDVVLAWRIQLLTLLGRETPDLPCTVFCNDWEVRVREALHARRSNQTFDRPLTVAEVALIIARLGGHLIRPSEPPPGRKAIWRGLVRFHGRVDGFRLVLEQPRAP